MGKVKFPYYPQYGYKCRQPGDMTGDYSPAADYEALERRLRGREISMEDEEFINEILSRACRAVNNARDNGHKIRLIWVSTKTATGDPYGNFIHIDDSQHGSSAGR